MVTKKLFSQLPSELIKKENIFALISRVHFVMINNQKKIQAKVNKLFP